MQVYNGDMCTEWIFRDMVVTCLDFTVSPLYPIGDSTRENGS